MATTNPSVATTWTKVVDNTDGDFLLTLPLQFPTVVEIATTAADSAPDAALIGHALRAEARMGVTRLDVGSGYVWARCKDGARPVVLSA